MARWIEAEECGRWCGYFNMSPTSNTRRCFHPQTRGEVGKTIDSYEPGGFPAWCPGIDLDELRAKYQEALQHIGDEGECPLKIFDYDLELRYDINAFPCKEIRDGCPYNDEAWDLSYNGLVLSCWDKYFEMEVSNGVSEGECINTDRATADRLIEEMGLKIQGLREESDE